VREAMKESGEEKLPIGPGKTGTRGTLSGPGTVKWIEVLPKMGGGKNKKLLGRANSLICKKGTGRWR